MSLIEDLRPFLQAGRLFGFGPYSINSVELPLSSTGVVYSGMCAIIYTYVLYMRLEVLTTTDVEIKLRFLTIVRTILSEFVIFVDILVCIMWHHKLQASLAFMQRYDLAVKLEATPRASSIRHWLGLSIIGVYFFTLGWLTYMYESWKPLESSMVYVVLYTSTTFGTVKFTAIVASLLHRFRHLNRLLKAGWSRRQLNLRDAWYLHGCLIAAAEELNGLYSVQLLLWIAGLTFNVISRIYVFSDTDGFLNIAKLLREGGIAAAFVILLTVLAGVCHLTAAEHINLILESFEACVVANSMSSLNKDPVHDGLKMEESIQIGLYFLFHQFNFYAAFGFLRVDLPLLQTIAGTMTTYLVILKAPG